MQYNHKIYINNREISVNKPTYFIADIASNHDGDLERAKALIYLAKEAGADAAKFQHFLAPKIVSDYGFKSLNKQISHQARWDKSVFEIYKQYECNREWTEELVKTAKQADIDFLTTPYDKDAINLIDPFVSAYKIGSGDITWTDFLEFIAKKNKPVFLATGASDMTDVERSVNSILKHNKKLVLMQCNTNYTGDINNLKYVNLRVLQTFSIKYPNMVLGLSDHTPGHSSVLGAIVLGSRVIEKHFTDDNNRKGPDHAFSMSHKSWKEMINCSRELEMALGDEIKRIEPNEYETVILQQRCLRVKENLKVGKKIQKEDLEFLRPAPEGSIKPYDLDLAVGKTLAVSKNAGDALYYSDLEVQYAKR